MLLFALGRLDENRFSFLFIIPGNRLYRTNIFTSTSPPFYSHRPAWFFSPFFHSLEEVRVCKSALSIAIFVLFEATRNNTYYDMDFLFCSYLDAVVKKIEKLTGYWRRGISYLTVTYTNTSSVKTNMGNDDYYYIRFTRNMLLHYR